MPDEEFTYRSVDATDITGYRWDPVGAPATAVVLLHGMGEHALRYEAVARELVALGAVVYAPDHRGHGASIGADRAPGDLGPGGWQALVDDIGLLVDRVRGRHPRLPLILVAHSMGSFAVQQYLLDHSSAVDGVALTGTAALDLLEAALDLDDELDLSMFNDAFPAPRTSFDWLSRDDDVVDIYLADPLCGFGIDSQSAKEMFVGARRIADAADLAKMRSNLPIYIAVGDMDPVNGSLALMWPLADRYRSAGVTDLTVCVYEGARHEILNETNRGEVVADLIEWLKRISGGGECAADAESLPVGRAAP